MIDGFSELEQLKRSLALAPCGIGLFDVESRRLVFLNQAYYRYTGGTPEENQQDFLGDTQLLGIQPDPLLRERCVTEFQASGCVSDCECRIRRKDGALLWLKLNVSTVLLDGKAYAFACFTDITKEKELERKALREQNRLRLVADEVNAAVFEWTEAEGRFYSSSAYENYAISQVGPDALLHNQGPTDLVHPDDAHLLKQFFDRVAQKQTHVDVILRLKMTAGGYRWCKMVGLFFRDENGKLLRTVGIIMDVNDKHEHSAMLDSLINAMPCGVGIFTFAETLLCEYYSDGLAKLAGISREEMDGLIAKNTVFSTLITPDDYPKITTALIDCTARGLPLNLTFRYLCGDGGVRWLHLSGTKLREQDGYPVYYCVFTNPTEESAQYGNVVEDAPLGVFVAELATRKTLFVNAAACTMFGFPPNQRISDRSILEVLEKAHRAPFLTRQQVDSLQSDAYSRWNLRRDGKYYSVQAKRILWNGVQAYILYFSDRTNEQTLINSIPGGVAIYRVKRDGRITTDYVSDGLAAMCDYTAEEFLQLLREDATVNLVPEDIPMVMERVKTALETHGNLGATYRIYTRSRQELLIRLDANQMPQNLLGPEDVVAFYAVHTIVSEEFKSILQEQKRLYELINAVPAGIGIYEIVDGQPSQDFMNDAFYAMIGSRRDKRMEYMDKNTLNAAHPDDIPNIRAAIGSLLAGQSRTSVAYRVKVTDGWFWVNLTASVVKRKGNAIKIYAAFTDYNEVMQAAQSNHYIRKTMEIALKTAGILAWRYDYKTKTITDSATLGEAYHLPSVVSNVPQAFLDAGFVAKESEEAFLQLFREVAQEKVASMEFSSFAPDGTPGIWYRQIYTPVFDKDGRYVDAVGIAMDITEQKQHQQQYEEQQRLSKIAAADALSTVSMNLTQNTVLSFTSGIAEFARNQEFTTADALLQSVRREQLEPEDRQKFRAVSDSKAMLRAFASGKTHIEFIIHYQEGGRWIKVTYDMLKNPYTGDVEAVSSLYDVTQTVRDQKVISQLTNLDYQSLLLINAADGSVISYQSGSSDKSREALLALREKEKNAHSSLEDLIEKYGLPTTKEKAIHDNSLETVKQALASAPSYSSTYTLVLGGKTEYFRMLYTYLKDDHSIILVAEQNVTKLYIREMKQRDELAAALSQAESANKAKTAFLSRVSHDMRTPLNGILGLTNLMKDICTDDRINQDLSQLELSGKYLLELINDTLDVSRIESGKLELHSTVCDSRICFQNVQNLIRPGLEEKHIAFELTADNLPFSYLYVDEGRLQQIAMNILGNAIKFTPEGGHIRVLAETLSMDGGIVTDHFVIQDSGCGMSREYLPHLFEAFSQENASTTNVKQGTGLGMSITKHLVDLMDGEIKVDSEIGKGTTFDLILRLPIATQEQVQQWHRSRHTHAVDYNLHGKRILLCEDHPLNTRIALRLLRRKGMIVEHAENGRIGVKMFEASQPGYYDAILMDIRMPEMDGIDAARAIRALDRKDAKTIAIIAMTANALDMDIKNTQEAGMDAHLSKPVIPERLYGTLEHFLSPQQPFLKQRLLVVDDMEVNRAAIRAALEPSYEVFEAENGQQALEILRAHNGMDAVVTDIQMPVMNGEELIRQIRSDNRLGHVVIIASTQYELAGQEEQLLALGANDFIYKPTNPDVVRIRVKNALRSL